MKNGVLILLFLICTGALFAEEPFKYRYWMVPAEKIAESPWGNEKYYPIKLERFERWISALTSPSRENGGAIREIELEAKLAGSALSEGEGHFRFSEKETEGCNLAPCSIALSNLRWSDGSQADVGAKGDGPVSVTGIPSGGDLLFSWSLGAESTENHQQQYRFELPPSPATRLRLQLGEDFTPTVDTGLVTPLDEPGSWLIEPGPNNQFLLTLTEKEQQTQALSIPPTVAEQLFCNVTLDGIEINYTAVFYCAANLPQTVTLQLDEPFLPEKIEWHPREAADAVWEKEGRIQKIIVKTPSLNSENSAQLTLTAFAPFTTGQPLRLPPVRCSGVQWQETAMGVTFTLPAAPQDYIFSEAERVGAGGTTGLIHLLKRTGYVEIPLGTQKENISLESASRIDCSASEIRFETDLLAKADQSGTRRLTVPFKPQWVPESASIGGTPIPFRYDSSGDSGLTTLALEQPIPTDRQLRIRITGRRILSGDTLPLADYFPLVLDEPMSGEHLITLSTNDESSITLLNSDTHLSHPEPPPEETIRRLFGSIPNTAVFSFAGSTPDLTVRFDQTPNYTAFIEGRAVIQAQEASEEWNIRCTPQAGSRLDRILLTFKRASDPKSSPTAPETQPTAADSRSTNDFEPWQIISGSLDDSEQRRLEMRPPTEAEREEYQLSADAEIGEILLPAPRSTPFIFHLRRRRKPRLDEDLLIPLLMLCGASNQSGRIDVVTPDFAPIKLETSGLAAVAPSPKDDDAKAEFAAFTYEPAEPAASFLKVKKAKGGRRSAWCRFIRIESEYSPGGVVRSRAVCHIENKGNSSLLIRFPKSLQLINAGNVRSEKEPVFYSFHPEERKMEIPLPVQQRSFTFSFDYECQTPNFSIWGYARRQTPNLCLVDSSGHEEPMAVLEGEWSARIPAEFRFDTPAGGQQICVSLASPTESYRFVSGYYLSILGYLLFFLTTVVCLPRRTVHIVVFALPILLLYFLAQDAATRTVYQGIFAGCITSSLFTFFYNRPLKTPPREESLGFVLPKGTALLLFLLTPISLAAEETYSIFVPTREGKAAVDEPAWVPEKLRQRLHEWESRSLQNEGEARILSALYEGQINYNRETERYTLFRLTAKYRVFTAETDAKFYLPPLPVAQEEGILVDDVAGSVTRSLAGGRMALELHGVPAGMHLLEIPLFTEPFGEKEAKVLSLPLPAVPDAKLLLRLPNDVPPPRLLGAMGQVSSSPGFLTADLGQTQEISFLPPEKESRLNPVLIEAEQLFRLTAAENRVLLHGEFHLHISDKTSEISFLIDPRYKLLSCTGDGADLIPAPLPNHSGRLSIALRQPVSGELTLHADFEPVDFGGVGELPLPMIRVADASLLSNRLLMPDGYQPPEYDLSDSNAAQKSILLSPRSAKPTISESGFYQFGSHETSISYKALLETNGSLWQLSLRVPNRCLIESVSVINAQGKTVPFQRGEGVSLIHLLFDESLNGSYQLNLSLRTLDADVFPLVGILNIPASAAELSFQHTDEVYAEFTPPDDWGALPAEQSVRRWNLPAAAASLVPPPISIKENLPKITFLGDILYYPLANDPNDTWELRADLAINITEGQLPQLEFEIDESLRTDALQIEPASFTANIDRFPNGKRRLTLSAPAPLSGKVHLVLRAAIQRSFPRLPKLVLPSAKEEQVLIRLPIQAAGQPLKWQFANLEKCKTEAGHAELQGQSKQVFSFTPTGTFPNEVREAAKLHFNEFQAYRPAGKGPYTASIPGKAAAAELTWSEAEFFLHRDNSYWGRVAYDLRLGAEHGCDIRIPSNQKLLSAETDGIPLLITPTEKDDLFHIDLYPESPLVRLTLTYEAQPAGFQSLRAGQRLYAVHRLTAPRPENTNSAPGLWTIHFDNETRHIPYYVGADVSAEIPSEQIRKTFPGIRESIRLPETGPWKRPVSSNSAEALLARLNIEKLGHWLELLDSADSKQTFSAGKISRWLETWTPLYESTRLVFSRGTNAITDQQRKAFSRITEAEDPDFSSLSDGKEEFTRLQERWETLQAQLDPGAETAENPNEGKKPSGLLPPNGSVSDEKSSVSESAGKRGEGRETDFLLLGISDRSGDILLLTPVASTLSRATFRTGLQIFAFLFAMVIVWASWRSTRRDRAVQQHKPSPDAERAVSEHGDQTESSAKKDTETQKESKENQEPSQTEAGKPGETGSVSAFPSEEENASARGADTDAAQGHANSGETS